MEEEEELEIGIEPFGIQDTTYPEIFPLGQKQYACLYGNYYAFLGSNNKTEYIRREAPPRSKVLFLNIQRKNDLILCSSISIEAIDSPLYIELIWWSRSSKEILRKIKFFLNWQIKTQRAKVRLSLVQMMKNLENE